jgi:zinc finger FYVE domain-containing protein 1
MFTLICFVNSPRTKCNLAANHQKENIPHHCDEHCSYNKELDNEIMKCVKCDQEGRNTVVYEKLIATNNGLAEGIVKYVWSGFVIECPKHGEIFRSRQYWYGNSEPKTVTRVEIIHVWPGDDASRLASDVTPRKVIEVIRTAGRFVGYEKAKQKDLIFLVVVIFRVQHKW